MKVLANLDLSNNQLLNVVLQNLAGTDPASPVEGMIFRDTTAHTTEVYGAAAWEVLSVVGHTHTYIPLATVTEQGDIIYASGSGAVAALAHGTAGYLLQTGGDAANPSWVAPYAHPTTNGNKHVPATGASANILQYASEGTAKWVAVSGDITIADGGATAIGANKVTLAMLATQAAQTVLVNATDGAAVPTALALTASTILGRAAAGNIVALSATAAGLALLDDATAADQLTTLGAIAKAVGTAHGDLLYFSAAGTPAVIPHGTDNQVLHTHSDGSAPAWGDLAAGHTQNTDTGTTGATFSIDSDATAVVLKNNGGVLELKNAADDAYMDLKVKDLTVYGTSFTVEAETITLHDNIILLNENAADDEDGGIQVERGAVGGEKAHASLLWNAAADWWTAGVVGSELRLARTYAVDVGDGAAESIDVVHNLNTRDVVVQLHLAASTYDAVITDWVAKDANTITLTFAVHPSAAQYRCVVVG
jgi:hypothetical protein